MALKSDFMALGIAAAVAAKLGFDPLTVFAAAGSSQATATTLTANNSNITSGTGGVIIGLPNETNLIMNNSGSNITVYPPVGGTINGGTLNAGFTLTSAKSLRIDAAGTNYIANMSA